MPKFKADSVLLHKGKIVQVGEEVELTAEQAEALDRHVSPLDADVPGNDDGKPLEDFKVDELKDMAAQAGVEGYSDMKKAELIAELRKG